MPLAEYRKRFTLVSKAGSCALAMEPGSEKDKDSIEALSVRVEGRISDAFKLVGAADVIRSMPKCELFVAASPACLAFDESSATVIDQGSAFGLQRESSSIYMLAPSRHTERIFVSAPPAPGLRLLQKA